MNFSFLDLPVAQCQNFQQCERFLSFIESLNILYNGFGFSILRNDDGFAMFS